MHNFAFLSNINLGDDEDLKGLPSHENVNTLRYVFIAWN